MKTHTNQYDVFVVDDDEKIRRLISEDLEKTGYKVSSFANATDCLERLQTQNCNLLITDVKMPGMDGLTLLRKAKHEAPWVPVLVITGFGDIPMAVRALKLGAVDFIEKPLNRKDFLQKIKNILEQEDFIDLPASHSLTNIEKKVLNLILDGRGNKEIAYSFQRTVRTIERHRSNIMHKLKVDNIVDLVKKAASINLDDAQ